MADLNVDGMALAPSVVETIISIAAKEVEGVAAVGSSSAGGIRSKIGSKSGAQGIEVEVNEDQSLHVSVRVDVYYGHVLPELAAALRASIAEAVTTQVGVAVDSVDVYIDAIRFPE